MLNRVPVAPHPMLALDGPLAPIGRVLANYAWTWVPECRAAARAIDPERFDLGESPIRLLADPSRAERLASDVDFFKLAARAEEALDR